MDALGGELRDDAEIEVPISAIEHFSYCPRQCALIHVEQTFDENLFTVRGRLAHERVDAGEETSADGVRTVRAAPLWSERLGLRGKADAIEFRVAGPYPIEYKVGRRHGPHADLQLCAQALCLEEMLDRQVPEGAIYYHATHRRQVVTFDDQLRQRTVSIIQAIREMLVRQLVPAAVNDDRCPNCSLLNACLPSVVGETHRLRGLQGALFRIDDPHAEPTPLKEAADDDPWL
ncbi:MAG: CRISPR-associated protein Cas4 [Chloroflexota bacterium]